MDNLTGVVEGDPSETIPIDRLLTFTGTVNGVAGDYVCVDDALGALNLELVKLNSALLTMNAPPAAPGGLMLAVDAQWAAVIVNVARRHAGERRPLCVVDRGLLGVRQ